MNYNPNIHHRRSIRLKGYDYSQAGAYFITICCDDRKCLFGKIENGKMILNEYGNIAYNEWMKTPTLRKNVELGAFVVMPNHIHGIIFITRRGVSNPPGRGELHSPDLHSSDFDSPDGRGELHSPDFNSPEFNSSDGRGVFNSPDFNSPDDRGVFNTPQQNDNSAVNKMGEFNSPDFESPHDRGVFNSPLPQSPSQTVGAIVRGYKSAVTKQINGLNNINKGDFNSPQRPIWQRNYWEHIIRNEQSFEMISNYIRENPKNWGKDKLNEN